MKKISILAAFFCLLLTGSAFAQTKTTNFAGSWELDLTKSKLDERMRVESMTMNVTQTDKELKVLTATKRAPRPEGDQPVGGNGGAMRPNGGMGRGAMMGGGNTVTYSLDGKETTVEMETPAGGTPASMTLKAETQTGGKLKLTSSRTFNSQMGAMTVKTTETWELADGGKGLKVTRNSESPRGTQTSEMYFTKKDSLSAAPVSIDGFTHGDVKVVKDPSLSGASRTETPKAFGSQVLNGKATTLVQPVYPPAARAVKASGAVNVQVMIDEQGNVVSAAAVSGHPLLRSAAEEAARNSKFSPTIFGGVPVKVTGIIFYNFTP